MGRERAAALRVPGHKLIMEWSGEYGDQSSSTGTCKCGRWEESASSQRIVRVEYREHLRRAAEARASVHASLRGA